MFAVLILQLFLNKETIQMETVLNWITEYMANSRVVNVCSPNIAIISEQRNNTNGNGTELDYGI
jgi:hypothetical protein